MKTFWYVRLNLGLENTIRSARTYIFYLLKNCCKDVFYTWFSREHKQCSVFSAEAALMLVRDMASAVTGGGGRGTLQQLDWISRGGSGVQGGLWDCWRQEQASRSGWMKITKTQAGSHALRRDGEEGGAGVPGSQAFRMGQQEDFHFLSDNPFLSIWHPEKECQKRKTVNADIHVIMKFRTTHLSCQSQCC